MLTVAELWACLDTLSDSPLPAERVPLADALDRVLREPINAPEDQPPFARSAIDGYLVHASQPIGPVTLVATHSPGAPPLSTAPAPGSAIRILTGSALPAADCALVMQEDTRLLAPDRLELLVAPNTRHIRPRASQARAGDTLLASGRPLRAGALSLLASLGAAAPLVTRRARIAHLVTGGELVPLSATPAPGQIRDSNSTLVAALLAEAGADLVFHQRVSDSRADTSRALAAALVTEADLLLISGGASVGDHDHTGALLAEHGFTVHCDKVSSRPGKPFIAASLVTPERPARRRMAFGLPGNPLSHFVCFHLFVRRVLARLAGTEPVSLARARLAPGAPLRQDPRETWWPCTLSHASTQLTATPLPWRDSSDQTVLVAADALLRVPAYSEPAAEVEILPCR